MVWTFFWINFSTQLTLRHTAFRAKWQLISWSVQVTSGHSVTRSLHHSVIRSFGHSIIWLLFASFTPMSVGHSGMTSRIMVTKVTRSDRVTKWLNNQVTMWASDQVTTWLSDQVTDWQSDWVSEWQSDWMTLSDYQASLLCRLQAQTLPDATPSMGKIHPFIKMTITFEPLLEFWCPLGFRKFLIIMTMSFYNWKTWLKPFGHGGAVKLWVAKDWLINRSIN